MKTVQRQLCDSVQDMESCGSLSSAQLRKINKPIVEKKRRERINACLDELKDLLLQSSPPTAANKQNEANNSKLEKADILEMTVRHLRSIQRRQLPYPTSNVVGLPHSTTTLDTPASAASYRDGYSDCAREVATYLGRLESVGLVARTRVLSHLSSRLRSVNGPTSSRPAITALSTSVVVPTLRPMTGCASSLPSSSSLSPPTHTSFPIFESSRRQDRVATLAKHSRHRRDQEPTTAVNDWSVSTIHHHRSVSGCVDRTTDDVIVGKSTTFGRDDEMAAMASGTSSCDAFVGSSGVKQEVPSSSSSGFDVNGNHIDYSNGDHHGDDVWRPW